MKHIDTVRIITFTLEFNEQEMDDMIDSLRQILSSDAVLNEDRAQRLSQLQAGLISARVVLRGMTP